MTTVTVKPPKILTTTPKTQSDCDTKLPELTEIDGANTRNTIRNENFRISQP